MKKPTDMGLNRTGIGTSPIDAKKSIEGAEMAGFTSEDVDAIRIRTEYARSAEPIGTVPPPGSLTAAVSAGAHALAGEKMNVLLDKLGERIAFERTGTRLYELLIVKHQAKGHAGAPSLEELREIMTDELRHFGVAKRAIESLGGDPTCETPSADVNGVIGSGILKVIGDPRTTMVQALQAILTAELADNAGWDLLIRLAQGLGQDALVPELRTCMQAEQRHLERVERWVSTLIANDAGVKLVA